MTSVTRKRQRVTLLERLDSGRESVSSQSSSQWLSVFSILFLLGLFACPTIEAETDYQGPGLYKDGERVIDLQEMTASTAWGPSIASAEKSAERKAFLERIMGGEIPPGSAEQEAYISVVLQCRELIQQSFSQSGDGLLSSDIIDRLLVLEGELDRTHKALREKFDSIELRLSDNRYPVEKLRQHAEVVRRRNTDADHLLALFSDLRDAQVSADMANLDYLLGALRKHFADHDYIQDRSSLDNGPKPMVMESKRPPVIESSGLPEQVKYPVLPGRSPDPADLDPTIDVQFTDDIIDLATELNHSPAEIYTFVRNNCIFECYLGSRKGSQQTLEHMRGNDYDLASLMIALLRVSGVPARYASGRAYVTSERYKNWLGFEDMFSALVMQNSNGFQIIYHMSGADTVGAEFNWIWVEAYMPFINYRGAVNDSTGYQWVPLDPAFKQYEYNPGIYLFGEMNFDVDAFLWDYYSTFHEEPPIEMFKQLLEDSLAIYHPGATMEDIPRSRTVIDETDGILPGTLPYQLLSYDGSFSEIPDNMRYKIRFRVHGSGTDLDYTTSVPEIASKQVTLTYVGATPADQQMIDDAGGIWHVEVPWLVDLKPVLKIDGCEVARGAGQVMMGITHYSDMEFFPPTGAPVQLTLIQNYITAGNYQGLGIDTEDAFPEFFDIPETSCDEEYMGEVLHQTSLTYLNNVDVADDELCDLIHIVLTNDISEAIVENTVSVYYDMWGDPISFDWTGMIVDADRKIVGPYSVYGNDILCDFMKLSGADGSIQENRVFETKFDEEAVSTIKIFELASDSGITLCHITTSISADCPGLSSGQPPHVINAVNACLASGRHVIIPEQEFTYHLWTGTGWICMDPSTCAAGYIISGGIDSIPRDGGSTVQEWKVVYVGLQCLNPIGPITVSPQAANNLYCAESNAKWVFTVNNLEYIGQKEIDGNLLDCQHLNQLNTKFNCSRSIKSIADDPELGPGEYTFKVFGAGPCPACSDLEEKVYIVDVEMTAYREHQQRDGDGIPFIRREIPDGQELDPGLGIRLNGDDDNHNGFQDRNDNSTVTGENDLIEIVCKVSPSTKPAGAEYFLRRSNGNIKVWEDRTKGTVLLDLGTEAELNLGGGEKTIWVERIIDGSCELSFVVRGVGGGAVVSADTIGLAPFTSVIVVLGGEDHPPGDPPPGQTGLGFVAFMLHTGGYDVHMFDEDSVDRNGAGSAYDEVVRAVRDRGVGAVAVVGYSHGGGSVNDLVRRLDNNRGAIGSFTIAYTAYVDAIDNRFYFDRRTETELPQSTQFHVNYYQPSSDGFPWVHGGPIVGSDFELDVSTTDWGAGLLHGKIDDALNVIIGVHDRLVGQVTP